MANDENKFLPIFQILDIKNVSFLLKLEMALATTITMKFEPVWFFSKKTHSNDHYREFWTITERVFLKYMLQFDKFFAKKITMNTKQALLFLDNIKQKRPLCTVAATIYVRVLGWHSL